MVILSIKLNNIQLKLLVIFNKINSVNPPLIGSFRSWKTEQLSGFWLHIGYINTKWDFYVLFFEIPHLPV